MKVKDLIAALSVMPLDAEVWHLWDGHPYTAIELVWLARSGDVVTADYGMVCYEDLARPLDAPSAGTDKYWETQQASDPDDWKEFPRSERVERTPQPTPEHEPFGGTGGLSGRAEFNATE